MNFERHFVLLRHLILIFALSIHSFQAFSAPPQKTDPLIFDDALIYGESYIPKWFKLSFLDLRLNLANALKEGKQGIILYFGRDNCAYCKSLLINNWGDPSIVKFTQKHFDVIAIDVSGQRTITDFQGKKWSEKEFSNHNKTNFTPTLLFYNSKKQIALKLPGYRPKYQFRAALEFVADAHYKHASFRQFLKKAEASFNFGSDKLNENDAFNPPPYHLNHTKKPVVVFFEHISCHACDVLHGNTLNNKNIMSQLKALHVVQLNSNLDTPVITPQGIKTTAKQWAENLDLTFAPSIIFFDTQGKEIIRVESIIHFHRLNKVLKFINSKDYMKYNNFQDWLQDSMTLPSEKKQNG